GDEELQAVRQERIRIPPPRQRRDFRRIGMDEGRLRETRLAGLLEDRELQDAWPVAFTRLDADLRASRGEVVAIPQPRRVEIRIRRGDGLLYRAPGERCREVDLSSLVGDGAAPGDRICESLHHALDEA